MNRYQNAPKSVYNDLHNLVQDKDYFVLTTNVDHCFQKAGFDKHRLFYTQGDYGLWQCGEPCHDTTYDNETIIKKMVAEQENMRIPSELISSLNCGEEDFAIACMRSNLKYGKNQKREDVKSHHYIISFDPRDAPDNGLTVDRAQALGEEFCKTHFPGHQALVCTHPDGHNHSGNIHVHIVINSLRIAEVPLLPYMERPADTREGCKHRCTDAAMEYFKAEVMEMCHRENLYQIDLLNGSKNRVTEREYWAKRKGQAALDKENASQAATGEPPKQTKFETDKEKLRRTIRAALSSAVSFEDFSGKLLQQANTMMQPSRQIAA